MAKLLGYAGLFRAPHLRYWRYIVFPKFGRIVIQPSNNITGASTERNRERRIVTDEGSLKRVYTSINPLPPVIALPCEGKRMKSYLN